MILKRTGVIQGSEAAAQEAQPSASASAWAILPPGTVLQDRYEILGVLGHGGMSTVYRSRDRRFSSVDRIVAIKEMFNVTQDAAARRLRLATFEREANLLATLQHPAIPKIHDYFTVEGRIYLVLELIEGQNLETVLDNRHGPISEPELVDWGVQICDLLTYLHTRKPDPIIFRDMKPSNIMLRESRQIVLVDFGIARSFQGGQRGTMIGTEGYAPPEQYRGLAGPTGDVYALGATLHHLATANDPRLETPFTFHQRPPRQFNPALSPAFEEVILKAVNYNANHRFATAEEFRQGLLASQRPTATRTPTVRLDSPAARPPTASLIPAPAPAKPVARARKPVAEPPKPAPAVKTRGKAGGRAAAKPVPVVVPVVSDDLDGVESPERIRWTVKTGDEVRGSPTVADDHVYFGSYDGQVYAVDLASGAVSWRSPSTRGVCSTPAVTDDLVIFGSEDSSVYAVDRANGRKVWSYRTGLPVRSSPRVSGDRVYCGSDDTYLYCLDLKAGSLIWRTRTWAHIRSSPLCLDGAVCIGSDDGYLYTLDAETGSVLWRFQTPAPVISTPTSADGLVYFGSMDGHVYGIRLEGGERVWRLPTGQPVVASVTLDDGTGYVGSVSGVMYAIHLADGEILWQYEDPGPVTSTAAVDAGAVFYGSGDGCVRCLDRQTGEPVWYVKTGGPVPSSPALADGTLIIGSTDHHLYALTTDDPTAEPDDEDNPNASDEAPGANA